MKQKTINVLIKRPYQDAEVVEVKNELSVFQEIVGGLIEKAPLPGTSGVDIYVNEEGKLFQFDGNFFLPEYRDCVVGVAFLCSCDDDGNMTSLTDSQIEAAKNYIDAYALKNGEDVWQDYYYLSAKAAQTMQRRNGAS